MVISDVRDSKFYQLLPEKEIQHWEKSGAVCFKWEQGFTPPLTPKKKENNIMSFNCNTDIYENTIGTVHVNNLCTIAFLQGAGLELTQIPVSNKEKNYLDEQHAHLLQCLEKATVGAQ